MLVWVAALAVGLAVWFAVPAPAAHGRLTVRAEVKVAPPPARRLRWLWAAGVVLAVAAGGMLDGVRGGVAAFVLACAVATGAVLASRQRARDDRRAARTAVASGASTVAALLRAGRVPSVALAEAAQDSAVLRVAAAESAAGGDVGQALRRTAHLPGHEGLIHLAESWQVALCSGASLAGAWERAAEALEAQEEVERIVATEIAAARAGGRIMAALPLVGFGLAYVLGGDAFAFLVGTPLGWACLAGGVALGCAGVLWSDHVADRAGGR
ncbi:type II secretion system protein [Propioniciclava sp.]|uniref:type II secretion system F family protein n=1 Tax=Propioniciclava sp. TaxID=2038686 RepID=UPI00260D1517|nr:type II secretion system protein [Propioniciclava sp.]